MEHYLAAIAANNAQGYEIRAIIDVNPEALTIAAERDRERAAGQLRGQLHGLPVILKANIATADSMPTTAGAEVMQGFTTAVDAELVQQLRDEGAIILAKANLSEWANFRGQNSISGWSGLGGQTRNPHVFNPQSVWLKFRLWGGCCCRLRVTRNRHRNGRLNYVSGINQWCRRN